MALRAFISSTEIDLPPDFSMQVERHSPIFDEQLRTGDFTMNVAFPGTPRNRIAFGFSDELSMADKVIVYQDFRIEEDGEIRVTGVLELATAEEDDGRVIFDTDYFTLLLTVDIFTRSLAEVITKEVNLGATPAAIAAAGDAQNAATLSADGITGAVMKFPQIFAPEFYGDTNPWWMQESSKYRFESTYAANDNVEFRLPEMVQDHIVPPGIPYAIIPRFFKANIAIEQGQTPFSDSNLWQQWSPGIMNAQKVLNPGNLHGGLRINDTYSDEYGINRFSLLPYLQVHDVIRALAAAMGYTVGGEWMADTREKNILMESNLALDKSNGKPNYAYVGNDATVNFSDDGVVPIPLPLEDPPFENENLHWAIHAAFPGIKSYKVPASGEYLVSMKLRVRKNVESLFPLGYGVVDVLPADIDGGTVALIEKFVQMGTGEVRNIEASIQASLVAGAHYYPWIQLPNAGQDYDVFFSSFEVTNLETDNVNIWNGLVKYADHMPDMKVSEFLQALIIWKNLFFTIDPLNRKMTFDYTDNVLRRNTHAADIAPHKTTAGKVEMLPKKRFAMNYQELEKNYEKPGGYTELDPVESVTLLPAPIAENTFIFVRNENAYYATQEYDYGGRLVWEWAGYDWNDLNIEAEGELVEIRPQLGPIPIRRFVGSVAREMLNPVYEGSGRSAMFRPGGSRPALRVTYWGGLDGSVPDLGATARPYFRVNNTGRNQAGALESFFMRPMLMDTILETNYRVTLQMLVLEELYTALFYFPPSVRQLIMFHQSLLIGYVPVMAIRTREQIGASELMEIESRKVKQVRVEVINSNAVVVEGPQLWTPYNQENKRFWIDFSDAASIINDGTFISQANDLTGNNNHAVQATFANRPYYGTHALSGKKCFHNIAQNRWLLASIPILAGTYQIFTVYNNSNMQWFLPIVDRNVGGGAGFGIHSSPTNPATMYNCDFVNGGVGNQVLSGQNVIVTGDIAAVAGTLLYFLGKDTTQVSRVLNGDICEHLIVQGAMINADRQRVEGYLAHKWGLQTQLPITHPYFTNAPTI